MRDHPRHNSIRHANIFSILSSINIYPLLNTVLKIYGKINVLLNPILTFYELETYQTSSLMYIDITVMSLYFDNICIKHLTVTNMIVPNTNINYLRI